MGKAYQNKRITEVKNEKKEKSTKNLIEKLTGCRTNSLPFYGSGLIFFKIMALSKYSSFL